MIVNEGYTIEHYRDNNKIIVTLPKTLTITITDTQLFVILEVIKGFMEAKRESKKI